MSDASDLMDKRLRAAIDAAVSREAIDDLLARLPEVGGPSGVQLDENAMAQLVMGDDCLITLWYQPGFPGLILMVPVCDADDLPRSVLMGLLAVNAAWSVSAGGNFSIPGPDAPVTYCRRVVLTEVAPGPFVEELRSIARFVDGWQVHLDLLIDAPSPGDDDPPTEPKSVFVPV